MIFPKSVFVKSFLPKRAVFLKSAVFFDKNKKINNKTLKSVYKINKM